MLINLNIYLIRVKLFLFFAVLLMIYPDIFVSLMPCCRLKTHSDSFHRKLPWNGDITTDFLVYLWWEKVVRFVTMVTSSPPTSSVRLITKIVTTLTIYWFRCVFSLLELVTAVELIFIDNERMKQVYIFYSKL